MNSGSLQSFVLSNNEHAADTGFVSGETLERQIRLEGQSPAEAILPLVNSLCALNDIGRQHEACSASGVVAESTAVHELLAPSRWRGLPAPPLRAPGDDDD